MRSNAQTSADPFNIPQVFEDYHDLLALDEIAAVHVCTFNQAHRAPAVDALRAGKHVMVGESGSGKTTLARCILGLTQPTSGTVRYQGKDIQRMTKDELHAYRRAVQPVFQDPYSTYNPFYRIDRVLNMLVRKFKLADSPKERQLTLAEKRKLSNQAIVTQKSVTPEKRRG